MNEQHTMFIWQHLPVPALSSACVDVDLFFPGVPSTATTPPPAEVSLSADRLRLVDGAYMDWVIRWPPPPPLPWNVVLGDLTGRTHK